VTSGSSRHPRDDEGDESRGRQGGALRSNSPMPVARILSGTAAPVGSDGPGRILEQHDGLLAGGRKIRSGPPD
jgi:hypothetical protein